MPKYLTLKGLEKFKKELNYLKTAKRKEIAERLRYTASFGDLSENFAYHQAKEDQAFLEGRVLELEEIIRNAQVIKKRKTDKVQIGSTVSMISNDEKEKFQIVETEEADPLEKKISFQSPLGKAILGKKIGDIFEIETSESKIKYKILKIE